MNRVARADAASVSSATFAPLESPTFRAIWLAAQLSGLGWLFQTVAVSWLMATISTSDVMVALVQTSTTLPVFILSIFAGAIADNFSRRTVMAIGWCVIALSSIMLTALVALGFYNPWMILAFSCLAGCGAAFTDPAWHASVGDILRKREVPAAVTLISVGLAGWWLGSCSARGATVLKGDRLTGVRKKAGWTSSKLPRRPRRSRSRSVE
ncbi:MAG: MFS transporter [Mesorhizobium sp.]|nr:MAG: MFS transporter [Mesorhizobium sp.]